MTGGTSVRVTPWRTSSAAPLRVAARSLTASALETNGSAEKRLQRPIGVTRINLNADPVAAVQLGGQLARRAGRQHLSTRQHRHAIAETFRLGEIVRTQEDRAPAMAEPLDQAVHVANCHRVEAGGRFVEKDDVRVVDEGARHGKALPHPLAVASHLVVGPLVEFEALEQLGDALAAQRTRHAVDIAEILQGGTRRQAIVEGRRLGQDARAGADAGAVRLRIEAKDARAARLLA